jgi:20S proteasome subunit alpha 6
LTDPLPNILSQRSTGELASYQKKLIRIDDHLGIAIAGLTSDARVLSNFMRTQAMSSRMVYNRPLPVSRIVGAIADSKSSLFGHLKSISNHLVLSSPF